MRRLLLVGFLGACSFTPGAAGGIAVDGSVVIDGGGSGSDAAPASSCMERWLDGTIRFGTPSVLSVSSTEYERDPFLTADELTLYFSTTRGSGSDGDIYTASRPSLAADFSTPVEASAFNSTSFESKLSLTGNGLIAVLGSNRSGGSGGIDIWQSARASTNATFPAMNRTYVGTLDTGGNEHDPVISADGLRLYFAPDSPSPQRIMFASRESTGGNFGSPAELTSLTGGSGDADPALSADERVIVFSSARNAAFGGGNIWYATRASTSSPFGAPALVPDVNSTVSDGDPHLSADGCRIYFARDLGSDNWDLYVAHAQ